MTEDYEGELTWLRSKVRELDKLQADNERLRAENAALRRWKALDKPLAAAMEIANSHIEQARRALEPKP